MEVFVNGVNVSNSVDFNADGTFTFDNLGDDPTPAVDGSWYARGPIGSGGPITISGTSTAPWAWGTGATGTSWSGLSGTTTTTVPWPISFQRIFSQVEHDIMDDTILELFAKRLAEKRRA